MSATMGRWKVSLTLCFGLIALSAMGARADLQVIEFKTLPLGSSSRAFGINDGGVVVGEGEQALGGTRAIRSGVGGVPTSLGTLPGGQLSQGRGINKQGQVVGRSQAFVTGLGMTNRAFLGGSDGSMTDLGTLSGWTSSDAAAISNTGYVVGTASDRMGNTRAVRWNPDGTIRALVGLSTNGASAANDVNDRGQVVGWSLNSQGIRRAFLSAGGGTDPGAVTDLGSLTRNGWSEANGINLSGDVTGAAQTATGQIHAFFLSNGQGMLDIHSSSLGGSSYGLDVSSRGEVVGRLELGGVSRAFYWTAQRGMVDLNSLIAPDSGWTLQSANAINSLGQIVGVGTYQGRTRGFIIQVRSSGQAAVPEPSAAVLAVTGAALLAGVARRRRRSTRS